MKKILGFFLKLMTFAGVIVGGAYASQFIKKKFAEMDDDNQFPIIEDIKKYEKPKAREASKKIVEFTKKIASKSINKPLSKDDLNERQKAIMLVLRQKNPCEMKDLLTRISGVTERTLRRDLQKLEDSKLIKKEGTTKSAKYFLK